MRSLVRCVFQTLRSSNRKVASKLLTARSARSSAVKSPPSNDFAINALCLCHTVPSQRRLYSSSIDKLNVEAHIKQAYSLVDSDPEEALKIFNKLHDQIGNGERVLYGKGTYLRPLIFDFVASVLARLNRTDEALELLDQLAAVSPDSPISSLKASIHFHQGNFELAATNYEDALERFPDNSQLLAHLGEAYVNCGKLIEALNTFHKALTLTPNDWRIVTNIGVCYQQLGPQFAAESVSLAQQAAELQPDEGAVWFNLAEGYGSIGELDASLECMEKLFALDPHSNTGAFNYARLLLRLNRLDEAEKFLRELVQRKQTDVYVETSLLITLYLSRKKYEDARKYAEQLTKTTPFHPEAWFHLGRTYMTSDIDMAVKCFNQALSIDSEHVWALDGLVSCLYLKGQLDLALQYFQRSPNIGISLTSVHMYDEAEALIEILMVKFPHRIHQLHEGQMHIAAQKRDYAKEFKMYKKHLATSDEDIDKVNLLLLDNDFEGALNLTNDMLAKDPKNMTALIAKASILIEADRVKEAILMLVKYDADNAPDFSMGYAEVLLTAMSRDDDSLDTAEADCLRFPSIYASHMALSEVYRRRGDYQKALASWTKAQIINNSSPNYIFPSMFPYRYLCLQQKAKILESMGDSEGAMREYSNVLAINPIDVWSREHLALLKKKPAK